MALPLNTIKNGQPVKCNTMCLLYNHMVIEGRDLLLYEEVEFGKQDKATGI